MIEEEIGKEDENTENQEQLVSKIVIYLLFLVWENHIGKWWCWFF